MDCAAGQEWSLVVEERWCWWRRWEEQRNSQTAIHDAHPYPLPSHPYPCRRTGCRPGQIVNPSTNRCVSKKGKIGQELLSHGQIVNPSTNRHTPRITHALDFGYRICHEQIDTLTYRAKTNRPSQWLSQPQKQHLTLLFAC